MSATVQASRPSFNAPVWMGAPQTKSALAKSELAQSGLAKAEENPLAKLHPSAMAVTLAVDEELFDQDTPVRHCYQLVSGCLRTVRLMEDGRRLIDRFLLPGDLLGFAAVTQHDVAAQAVSPAVLRRYPLQAVANLAAHDTDFAHFLWCTAAAELRTAHGHGLLLGRKTAAERVASFLHDMATRMRCDRSEPLHLPMGRADIADHLGLTVETISRTLTQLRGAGIITVQPGSVGIRNIPALARLGDGTDSTAGHAMREARH